MKVDEQAEMCLIDTNAIIHTLTSPEFRNNIVEYIKGKNVTLVVCDAVFKELSCFRRSEDLIWEGRGKAEIIQAMRKYFGVGIRDYVANESVKNETKPLEEKYKKDALHWPDSELLAILLHESWDWMITNDSALKNCCESEGIKVFDQAFLRFLEPVKKPIHLVYSGNLKAYSAHLKKMIHEGESDDKIALVFAELSEVWNSLDIDSSNVMDEKEFEGFFKTTLFKLGKKYQLCKDIREQHGVITPELIGLFFRKIDQNPITYRNVVSALEQVFITHT